jgi:hypothetical protein
MKTPILAIAFFLTVLTGPAQIVLENNYPGSTTLTKLAISGDKYFMMDWTNNNCKIYNMNHSLWKTINLPVPSGWYLYDIRYVSETLFNLDPKVELVYVYYMYDAVLQYYSYVTKVINEDGSVLLSVDGGAYSEALAASAGNYKFLVYDYDYSVSPYTLNTLVYAVPGQLVSDEPVTSVSMNMAAYPNPATHKINIPYNLPDGTESAEIVLYDMHGTKLKAYTVDKTFSTLTINTSGMPGGLYYYHVNTQGRVLNAGKIIIQ